MKRLLAMLSLVAVATLSVPAYAAPQTVTLSVSGMTCPVCPITVKKALTKVEGVSEVTVNFDKKETAVTFDDLKTTAEALTRATLEAGYPSAVKQ